MKPDDYGCVPRRRVRVVLEFGSVSVCEIETTPRAKKARRTT